MTGIAYRERVGAELRRIRESLRISGEDVATALTWSQSKVSRVENARIGISMRDLATLLHFYGVHEEIRAELISMNADESGQDGAWIVRAGGTMRRQSEIASIETRVALVRQYHFGLLPGQLQAPSYTRWLVTAGGYRHDVEDIVRRRMDRQQLLTAEGAPEFRIVIDARALLSQAADREIVVEQWQHLKARMALPTMSVQIIPLDGPRRAMVPAPFQIYEFKTKSPAVVLVEALTADFYLSSPADVARHTELFEMLTADALSREESQSYLDTVISR